MSVERTIALIAGDSGAGKSFFVANLKKALIYDTDIGGGLAAYDARITRNKSERIPAASYKEVLEDLRRRRSQPSFRDFLFVSVDHVTGLHQEANLRHNPTGQSDYGRANAMATAEWRTLREFCRSADFNLICTAHLKARYENDKQSGMMPDGAKNIEADMSTVLYLRKSTGEFPSNAIVVKWRRDPEDPRGKLPPAFPFTVEHFEKLAGEGWAKEREPSKPATAEQVAHLGKLLELVKLPEGTVEKWWKKNGVESFEEMPADAIDKCITHVQKMIESASTTNGKKGD